MDHRFKLAAIAALVVILLLPAVKHAHAAQIGSGAERAGAETGLQADVAAAGHAAAISDGTASSPEAPSTYDVLPDSPGSIAMLHVSDAEMPAPIRFGGARPGPVASKYAHRILPGQQAQPLTAKDKMVYSTRDRFTVIAFGDVLWRAGWEQLINGKPHYGTDAGAFGERFGAAAIKETTTHVLASGVFAAAFHDDPRYYQLGDGHPFKQRVLYAGTRIIFTRKDDGKQVINIPRLAATVTVAGLNNLYYPQRDRGWASSTESVVTSLAMKAAGYEISEFIDDVFHRVHRRRE